MKKKIVVEVEVPDSGWGAELETKLRGTVTQFTLACIDVCEDAGTTCVVSGRFGVDG